MLNRETHTIIVFCWNIRGYVYTFRKILEPLRDVENENIYLILLKPRNDAWDALLHIIYEKLEKGA